MCPSLLVQTGRLTPNRPPNNSLCSVSRERRRRGPREQRRGLHLQTWGGVQEGFSGRRSRNLWDDECAGRRGLEGEESIPELGSGVGVFLPEDGDHRAMRRWRGGAEVAGAYPTRCAVLEEGPWETWSGLRPGLDGGCLGKSCTGFGRSASCTHALKAGWGPSCSHLTGPLGRVAQVPLSEAPWGPGWWLAFLPTGSLFQAGVQPPWWWLSSPALLGSGEGPHSGQGLPGSSGESLGGGRGEAACREGSFRGLY